MATIARIKYNGIHKEDMMYIGDMPFEKVCQAVERMIATNKLVQNADSTELRRTEEIYSKLYEVEATANEITELTYSLHTTL